MIHTNKTIAKRCSFSQPSILNPKFLFNPRYWPLLLLYSLLRLLILLPYRIQMKIGAGIGWLLYRFPSRRRRIIEINLLRCFPELSNQARQQLVLENFKAMFMCIFESALAFFASDKKLQPLAHLTGIENLERALEKGKGVILLSGHFTTSDMAVRLLNQHLQKPAHIMYRRHNNLLMEFIMGSGRKRHCEKTIGKKEIVSLFKSLKDNRIVFYTPDQNAGSRGTFVPFFGILASTFDVTVRIAKKSDACVVPFVYGRRTDGTGYDLQLLPILTDFPGDNLSTDVAQINQIIESAARQYPAQYFWAHQRFRSRPAGESPFYQ